MENILPKWLVNGLGGLLVVFVALLIIQQGYGFSQLMKNQKPVNTISVSADGKVTATPDLATVTIGVLTQGANAQDVKDKNNAKINKITDFIKKQGIDQKDITTSQMYFYPQQDWQSGTARITGYQGNQTVTVKIRNVDKDQKVLEAVLDGSVNAGANEIQGVNFSFNDPNAMQQQARELAIDNAKQKAQGLAQKAGLTLGKVVSISEMGAGGIQPMPYSLNSAMGMGGGGVAMEKSIAPDVHPGSQDITESMTVVFEVK